MEQGELVEYLQEAAKLISIPLSKDHVNKFLIYLHELKRWNSVTNLTSIIDDREVIVKHFIDSIAVLKFTNIPVHGSLLDIGAGAGFPSLPLKIVRNDLRPCLIEPNIKKASFLRYMTGLLEIQNISTLSTTLEEFSKKCIAKYDCLVIRALKISSLGTKIDYILKSAGKGLLYRADPMLHQELPEGASILEEFSYDLPFGYGSRVLTVVTWRSNHRSTWNKADIKA